MNLKTAKAYNLKLTLKEFWEIKDITAAAKYLKMSMDPIELPTQYSEEPKTNYRNKQLKGEIVARLGFRI
ncbi:MAG: hypothetical protein KAX49_07970 [Halanaerobiales bacterium]|nr:hypothetical protein [Halanaerobiales bacterium]